MRFIVADWGTSRFRAYRVEGETILDEISSDEGVSALQTGQHRDVFLRHCGEWLAAEPRLPVLLVGMVGSREGWAMTPYVPCPAGPAEIARGLVSVDLGQGRTGWIVPGLVDEPNGIDVDVMRGEETLALGSGIRDGLVCSPGTHPKWIAMRDGRVAHFCTYMTGEMYALLCDHSMIGRPAADPEDQTGFDLGLDASERNRGPSDDKRVGLLHLLFAARAAVVAGRMSPNLLRPYLSGLLTGDELNGALSQFGHPTSVTILADPPRAALYERALARRGVETLTRSPREALLAGLARLLREGSIPPA
ncbi:2-dehydro-3-deoxygalactonokinase [Microvirga antarctica]|uniref:2-dehydro-3-deoxygalactonokinase n=1 Tax=Microvirga antarctica TaxID=2819233 RepID=UPI001B308138|nr:2-dehydro-3-deoxygalactonokinase [Microvirga antarctica]